MENKEIRLDDVIYELRNIRKYLDLTQSDVAEFLGVTEKHISEIERGMSKPSLDTFFKLLNYYNSVNGQFLDMNNIFYKDIGGDLNGE